MAQFYRLLTSYRVPGITRDQLFSTLYQGDGSTEHIIVIHKNQVPFVYLSQVTAQIPVYYARMSTDTEKLPDLSAIFQRKKYIGNEAYCFLCTYKKKVGGQILYSHLV